MKNKYGSFDIEDFQQKIVAFLNRFFKRFNEQKRTFY